MSEKKLIKVTLEFEDEIKSLVGKDAQKWLEATNSMAVMEHIHGRPFPMLKWRIVKK